MSFLPALRLHSCQPHLNHLIQRHALLCIQRYNHDAAARQQVASEVSQDVRQGVSSQGNSNEAPVKASSRKGKARSAKKAKTAISTTLLSESSKVEAYLESLELSGRIPSLSDLEDLRPPIQPSSSEPKYAEAYWGLLDVICRSFTSSQLRQFAKDYQLAYRYSAAGRTKRQYAQAILTEKWEWPNPEQLERARKEQVEVAVQSFHVTPSQLYIIMGKDGSSLLEISKKHNVQISLTSKPLAMRIQGVKSALKSIGHDIAAIKNSIIEENVQLYATEPLPDDILQRIARTTGAFVENTERPGQVRICARDATTLHGAKRLAIRTALDLKHPNPFLVASEARPNGTAESAYNVYPFASPRPLPWTTGASSTYRCRRVGDYLAINHATAVNETEGEPALMGHILTVDERPVNLRETLLQKLDTAPTTEEFTKTVISASLGHLLFGPENTGVVALTPSSFPATPSYSDISQWLSERGYPVFVSSLPLAFLKKPSAQQKMAHRLVYHGLAAEDRSHRHDTTEPSGSGITRFLEFEAVLPELDKLANEESPEATKPAVRYIAGLKSEADILLLDRAMDINLSAVRSSAVELNDLPVELQQYTESLQAYLGYTDSSAVQPTPPPVLRYAGSEYILHHSISVRQNSEELSTDASPAISMTLQSVLDLESGEKHSLCQLTCEEPGSDKQWNSFLQTCDNLTRAEQKARITAIGKLETMF